MRKLWRSRSHNYLTIGLVAITISLIAGCRRFADPNNPTEIVVLADTFSGYSTFRNTRFQENLQERGITIQYQDEFDQEQRADRLNEGEADIILTTLDRFLKYQPDGKIVGLIDRTVGADAVVLNTEQYPKLRSLQDLQRLVAQQQNTGTRLSISYAEDTPSEFLALVLDTQFESFDLSDFQTIPVADAKDAWQLLQTRSDVAIAVIWEPFVTQAKQQGYAVALSSRDVPRSIVDVIVASDRVLKFSPEVVSTFLDVYYQRIQSNAVDDSILLQQIAEDGNLPPEEAKAIWQGIDFFTALEAYQWFSEGILEQRINSIAAVLVLSGRLDEIPPQPQQLYTVDAIDLAASKAQQLYDSLNADGNPLAEKIQKLPLPEVEVTAIPELEVEPEPEEEEIGLLDVRGRVEFEEGSAELTNVGKTTLRQLAQRIQEFPAEAIAVRVIGHTSKIGPEDYNLELSLRRARAAIAFLKSQGVQHETIAEGKGFSQPLPGVSQRDRRQQRTEIRLVRTQ